MAVGAGLVRVPESSGGYCLGRRRGRALAWEATKAGLAFEEEEAAPRPGVGGGGGRSLAGAARVWQFFRATGI